jgi:hypothetical protein
MDVKFKRLTKPSTEIAGYFHRWENDPTLIPYIRPNKNEEALEERETVTVKDLEQRLEHHQIYLIYLDDQLVGEMDFQIDPKHLCKKEAGTAWIGTSSAKKSLEAKGLDS